MLIVFYITTFIYLIFIFFISATDRHRDDAEILGLRPRNAIVIAGHRIILPCSSHASNESRWDFYDLDTATPTNIYNGNRHDANTVRRMIVDFNTCHLTIESVQLEDAGYYVCFESSSDAREAASLVVLGQTSYMNVFLIDVLFAFLCSLSYS